MTSRAPTDKRGRVRVAKILDAAAELIVESNELASVTTTAVAERSDQSTATVYRYFADRGEIIAALFDRETFKLDEQLIRRFLTLEVVTVRHLMETMVLCNFEFFIENPRASAIWFGSRDDREIAAHVRDRYAYIGKWCMDGARAAKLVTSEAPEFGGELIVWMGDAALMFIFSKQRSAEERQAVLDEWLVTIGHRVDQYSTPLGREGVSPAEFLQQAGLFTPQRIGG
jgi:AcrR family transcriptional regulator